MQIQTVLNKLFSIHRIVFWYDQNGELLDQFQPLQLPDVEKVFIDNNEWGLKVRITREQPNQRFLLYSPNPRPADEDNWLLDLNLAYHVFSADRASMIAQELGFPPERKPFIQHHIEFFADPVRLQAFTNRSHPEESNEQSRLKMMAVLVDSSSEFEQILFRLFRDMAEKPLKDFETFQLLESFWQMVDKRFHYQAENPSLKDLLIQLLLNRFYSNLQQPEWRLSKEASIFMNHWMDSARFGKDFQELSRSLEKEIDFESILNDYSYRDIVQCDVFKAIDQKIISALEKEINDSSLAISDAQRIIQTRRLKFWYPKYEVYYQALSSALEFLQLFGELDLAISSCRQGIDLYTRQGFRIDSSYRHFTLFNQKLDQGYALNRLAEKIENMYSNSYLLNLANNWQAVIDTCTEWRVEGIALQADFFRTHVKSHLKDRRVVVIISDALRFEAAQEFSDRLIQEDRFEINVDCMLSCLPSTTELGMAALLPHKEMSIDPQSGSLCVDGIKATSSNRDKIAQKHESRAITVQAKELLEASSDKLREWIKPYALVYVYHNHIDAIGDNFKSESSVFAAVEQAFDDLIKLVKKVVNMNVSNILLTADHGFLYQHRILDESDFMTYDPQGKPIKSNRRFVMGTNLSDHPAIKKFTAKQVGLGGEIEFAFAKSTNRLRIQGGGNRYVHGGTSLQEVIVPVLTINKKRSRTLAAVEVDIIKSQSRITTNEITIAFDQKEPVGDYVTARELKIGFFAPNGKLISDQVKLVFNSRSAENRSREQRYKFIFKKEANDYQNQQITLRLEELIPGTHQYKEYKQDYYLMNITIMNDFDDF